MIESKKTPNFLMLRVFGVAAIGLILSFVIQRTLYFYHILPALSLSILILTLLYAEYICRPITTRFDHIKMAGLGAVIAGLLYVAYPVFWVIIFFHPSLYFEFFAVLFGFTFFLLYKKQSLFKVAGLVFLNVGIGFVFCEMSKRTEFYSHTFFLTTLLLILLFTLISPKVHSSKVNTLFVGLLGAIFFAIPLHLANDSFLYIRTAHAEQLEDFIQHSAKHASISIFSQKIYSHYFIDSGHDYASRFSSFWMLQGLLKGPYFHAQSNQAQWEKDKTFLIEKVAEDLDLRKPRYVLVDVGKDQLRFYVVDAKDKQKKWVTTDYVRLFSTNANFKSAWAPYKFIKSIEEDKFFSQYHFQVYERKTDLAAS